MNCSMPGFPVHHQFLEPTQTQVHWVSDAIQPSHSVTPFSSYLQSFPASGSFLMSQFFTSGGQSIGVSASTSVLPMNTQDWSTLGWTGWISLHGNPLQYSCLENPMDGEACRLQSMGSQRVGHDWAISLHFTRLVIAFLPRNKHLLISWLQSPSPVILESKKIKAQ